jgi:hypothetical protein
MAVPLAPTTGELAQKLLQRVIGADKWHRAKKAKRLTNQLNTKKPELKGSGSGSSNLGLATGTCTEQRQPFWLHLIRIPAADCEVIHGGGGLV